MNSNEESNELRKELELKNQLIETNSKIIEKLLKENEISLKYNNELRDELKLLSAKLHLHQNVLRTTASSVSTQTDNCIDSDQDKLICANCKKLVNSVKNEDLKDWKQNDSKNGTKISDLVREIAEEVVQKNDFESDYLYDEKSKAYYSRSTGWYYYPESLLFYDPNSKNYFKYDSEKKCYNFHSTLRDMNRKRVKYEKDSKKSKIKTSNNIKLDEDRENELNKPAEISSEEEEGEISDSDGVSVISDDRSDSDIEEEEKEVSPPMVRMIVKESTTLEIGSLLLVTCMGAKIGNDSNCDLYITDESVSRSHAEIRYDCEKRHYVMRDLNSRNGTFANGCRVRKDCEAVLKHCDQISFGKCVLLVHIHWGKDVTCDRCEPGLVIASLKTNQSDAGFYSQTDKERDRKKQLKCLKKKYGLKNADFVETNAITNSKYKDRAEQRRTEKGSDNPYEKTAAGTSLDVALSDSNKGFKMLSKMGWSSGQALGRNQNGIVEPINVINPDLQKQTSLQTDS